MKNRTLLFIFLSTVCKSSFAVLPSDANLSIDTGSSFGLESAPGFWVDNPVSGFNGINIGTAQGASGSHAGVQDGTENPDIDQPWLFRANTGMHQSISPINIITDDGSGNVTLDLSGWGVTWNGIPNINLGNGPDAGIATMTCASDCSIGDSYILTYLATVPVDDPSGFALVNYRLNLSGIISTPDLPPETLPDNTFLSFDAGVVDSGAGICSTGTCFGMEVSPGFWLWTLVEPGTDGGVIIGKNQLSGGQELGSSAENITPGDISAAWLFFGNFGTFYADNSLNVFSRHSNDGVSALNDFNVAWNGNAIPMGSGTFNNYEITLDGVGGGSYALHYIANVPTNDPSGFGGIRFDLIARGSVQLDNTVCNCAPVANDISLIATSGYIASWIPDFSSVEPSWSHTCSITSNASNGFADVNSDCSSGTYISGVGYTGTDSFVYTVTDQNGNSASAVVHVNVMYDDICLVDPFCQCREQYPLRQITTVGGGQSKTVNASLETTFTGHLITTTGLTSGAKNSVKICPGTTVDFNALSPLGNVYCTINSAATATTGTLAIGDKLICSNKPNGSDTDRFSIKNGY